MNEHLIFHSTLLRETLPLLEKSQYVSISSTNPIDSMYVTLGIY